MSSTTSKKGSLWFTGGILLLIVMALAAIKSGNLADFVDPYGFIFVLVGGIALAMVSFSGDEIRRAIHHAAGTSGNDAAIRLSMFFWEAAGRNFWMLGALSSVLSVILGFENLKTMESAGVLGVIGMMTRSLLSSLYGILLAVICLVPCWKLMSKLQGPPPLPNAEQGEAPLFTGRRGIRHGAVIGYVLFFAALIFTIPHVSKVLLWNAFPAIVTWPSLLIVLGGTLALASFVGGVNSGPPLSTSFASMGLIGFLLAFIQLLLGVASSKITGVVSALGFVLSSCFIALLGMILAGAPLEDLAVRMGRNSRPSAFSRASWYGFPLLTLLLVPVVILIITTPLPGPKPSVTEVSAPIQEQITRYEARAPQSNPIDFTRASIQESHLLYKVNPAYPEEAKRAGIQGPVKLAIIINEEGFVYEAKGNPANNPILEKAAIPAVKRWRFSPFIMKGVPVALETTAVVDFSRK